MDLFLSFETFSAKDAYNPSNHKKISEKRSLIPVEKMTPKNKAKIESEIYLLFHCMTQISIDRTINFFFLIAFSITCCLF